MTALSDLLASWRDKANAATEGRADSTWHVDYDVPDFGIAHVYVIDSHNGGYDGQVVAETGKVADAEFIAVSREAVPRLLDAVERINALAERVESHGSLFASVSTRDIRAALTEALGVES